MDKQWVDTKKSEYSLKINEAKQELVDAINSCSNAENREKLLNKFYSHDYSNDYSCGYDLFRIDIRMCEIFDSDNKEEYENISKILPKLSDAISKYNACCGYLDSDPVEFDGDIIITDPCYIIKDRDETARPKWEDYMRLRDYSGMSRQQLEESRYFEDYTKLQEADKKWKQENPDDWELSDYGSNLEALGIYNYMTNSTLYGDWSCTTFNTNTKEPIGEFCADAGLVSVISLDEVLKYNPNFDDHINKTWTTTCIKNFKGTVQFVVKEYTGTHEEDTEWWNKGDPWTEYRLEVVGHGINKITKEPIDFVGKQTGF